MSVVLVGAVVLADDVLVCALAGTAVGVAFAVGGDAGTTEAPDTDGDIGLLSSVSGVWKTSDRRALGMSPLELSLAICCVEVVDICTCV